MKKHYVQRPNVKGNGEQQYFMGMGTVKPATPPVSEEQKIALQKLMVGHFIEKVPEGNTKKNYYILQGNGVYEQRINKLGTFTTKLAEVKIPGLESNLVDGWVLNVPKIPATFLGTIVSFFKKIYEKYSSEVFLQLYWDTQTNEYLIHCPKQTVSGASVKYDNDEIFTDINKILVFEIHSHGGMSAFFSGTDDGDEKADRFYGVIGNIKNCFPELKLRISVGGRTKEVKVEEIFDFNEEMFHLETFPTDWSERIKKEESKIGKGVMRRFRKRFNNDVAEVDDEMKALMKKFESEDYLYSQYEHLVDDDNSAGGYYVQEGDDCFFVKDGKKHFISSTGDMAEDKEVLVDYDPYDWRKARF